MSPENSDHKGELPARRRFTAGGLITAVGWAALALAGSSALGQRTWPMELVVHFWPQLGVLLLLTSLGALRGGRRLSAAVQATGAATLLIFVGVNLSAASSAARAGSAVETRTDRLTALFANVGTWNKQHDRTVELIRRIRPDIVGLAEIDGAWVSSLAALEEEYPHRVLADREDDFGTGLLSRLPIVAQSVRSIGRIDLPTIFATVRTPGGPWNVIVTHPVPPFHAAAFDSRNSQILGLTAAIQEDAIPTVVLADLNATPWSPYVRDLRERAELGSAASGLRARYTWPAGIPLLALELDHCLVTRSVVALDFRVLEGVGSDHYPILCELGRAASGAAEIAGN